MKYDIARAQSATFKVVSSEEGSRLVRLKINPKSSLFAADLDHKTQKLSEVSLEKFKKKSKLDQLEILGIENEDISAAFKVKDAELLDNGKFLISARLLSKPKAKDNKWNRADHLGRAFSETHINDASELSKKFTASAVFDFEGFQKAKEHVPELQSADNYFDYSNIKPTSTLKKRIVEDSYLTTISQEPLQSACDPNVGFSCSGWYTQNTEYPHGAGAELKPNYIGNPWLANVKSNYNSPFTQATSYINQDQVIQSSENTSDPAWQWRNVWGTIEHQYGTMFDLNRATDIDVVTFELWEETFNLENNIDLVFSLEVDIMPGLIFFTPGGFWAKLDPDNWAGAAGLSLRPIVSAKFTGFDSETDSYDITLEKKTIPIENYSEPCFEGINCGVKASIDISATGSIQVNSDQDLNLSAGVQGTVVGRVGGIERYDGDSAGAVVYDFDGFDSITGGQFSITVEPTLTLDVGLGVPGGTSDVFKGWLGNDLASLDATLGVPLTAELNFDELDNNILTADFSGAATFTPSIWVLPGTKFLEDEVWKDEITLVSEEFTTPNLI